MRPGDIHTVEHLAEALDLARRRAARGTGRRQVSISDLAGRTAIPRSTVHVYLTGRTLPPPDALDAILQALGVTGPELRDWADALERVTSAARAGDDPGPPRPRVPWQAPLFPPDVVGRERESMVLDDVLTSRDDHRAPPVVVLSGPGGAGKSTLAAQWAAWHQDDFPDGCLWIDLHGFAVQPVLEPRAALGRLLRALGQDDLPPDVESRADLFRSVVTGARMLLVLDNAADSDHVRPLLPGGRGCTVVVTSRSQLRTLVSQTGAERVQVGPLPADAGVTLLQGRGWPTTVESLAPALVGRCGGLPLAIRILRERLAGRGADDVARVADALADDATRLDVLEWHDGADRTGVRAVLAASYDVLSQPAAAVLLAFPACLGRGAEVAALAAATGTTEATAARHVDELVAANLVAELDRGWVEIPDLVASFADQVRRTDPAGCAAVDDRLHAWLLGRAELACRAIAPTWDRRRPVATRLADDELPAGADAFASAEDATTWLRENLDVVVGLGSRLLERGRFDAAWAVLSRLVQGLVYRADLTGAFAALSRAAGVAERDGRLLDAALVWRAVSVVQGISGDLHAARDAALAGAALAERSGNLELAAMGLANAAHSDLSAGRARECVDGLAALVELRARAGMPADDAWVHDHLTAAHTELGDFAVAEYHADRNLEVLSVPDGDTRSAAIAHLDRAWLELERGGDPGAALALVDQARARLGDADRDDNVRAGMGSIEGAALLELGRLAEAEALVESLRPVRRRALTPESVDLAVVQGRVLRAAGRPLEALEVFAAAVTTASRLQARFHEAVATWYLAETHAANGDAARAHAVATDGLRLAGDSGYAAWRDRFELLLGSLEPVDAS